MTLFMLLELQAGGFRFQTCLIDGGFQPGVIALRQACETAMQSTQRC